MATPISAPSNVRPFAQVLQTILDASAEADAAEVRLAQAEREYLEEATAAKREQLQAASRAALESEIRFELLWHETVRVGGRDTAPGAFAPVKSRGR